MGRFFNVLFGLAVVCIIGYWFVVGVLIFTGLNAVTEIGLKGLVEKVWCGKDEACKLPGNPQ